MKETHGDAKQGTWLTSDHDRLSFFINLHNFLVLFALCRDGRKPLPKTQLEWLNCELSTVIKVGGFFLTVLEIQHAILRSVMASPRMPSPYSDSLPYFDKFGFGDRRANFRYTRKEKYIDFALYLPTV